MWKTLGKTIVALAIVFSLLIGAGGYGIWYSLFREVPAEYQQPEEEFKYGSIQIANTEPIPYWVWLVLPRLFPEYLPNSGGYTALGLTWEEGRETPVGVSKAVAGVPRQGMTCAVCHHATVRETSEAKPAVFLGAPANKFDPQRYRQFLFDCANDARFTADYILEEIETYNHRFSWLEGQLYRRWIIPQIRKALLQQQAASAWMAARPAWGPGRSDAFNSLKFERLGQPLEDTIGSADMMPLWHGQNQQRLANYWDGLSPSSSSAHLGAMSHSAVPSSTDSKAFDRVAKFITALAPPAYPYEINQQRVEQGKQIFASTCAACHAPGGEKTGSVIPIEAVGTDRHRLDMWAQAAANAYNALPEVSKGELAALRKTNGYLAKTLDGLWLRAPYLHNGSVPTVRDLLTVPEERPQVFYRGYDVYDRKNLGYVADVAEEKGKRYFKYDTRIPANGNQGHRYGTELPDAQKTALVEYLKTL
ncbi:MAG: cytochrome c [Leptolyngbya sp. SIO4C1]|nr:cytochrome c [Leptolyngbya sp. SIO4C1]